MKFTSPLVLFCLLAFASKAQKSLPDSITISKDSSKLWNKDSLALKKSDTDSVLTYRSIQSSYPIPDSVVRRRNNLNQTNRTVLLAWAGANIVQGSISAGNLQGSSHFFHQMNAYFNIFNLGLAGYGLFEVRKQMQKKYSLYENLREQQKQESLLLFSTGLDAATISTGLYLQERGNNKGNEQTKGYGGSLILQGSFLFVFDLIQYIEHRQNGKLLNQYLGNLQLAPTANGIGLFMPI